MTPPVVTVTPAQLHDRQSRVLNDLGLTISEFKALLASNSKLTGEEWEAKEELDNIAFLLGEEPLD